MTINNQLPLKYTHSNKEMTTSVIIETDTISLDIGQALGYPNNTTAQDFETVTFDVTFRMSQYFARTQLEPEESSEPTYISHTLLNAGNITLTDNNATMVEKIVTEFMLEDPEEYLINQLTINQDSNHNLIPNLLQ